MVSLKLYVLVPSLVDVSENRDKIGKCIGHRAQKTNRTRKTQEKFF